MATSPSITPRWITYGIRYMIGMGLYGFTRGYRANYLWDSSTKQFVPHNFLIGDRVCHGLIGTAVYANPSTMPWVFVPLLNRVEIHLRGWKPEDYPAEYRECGASYCPTML